MATSEGDYPVFEIERYFVKRMFNTQYVMCGSNAQPMTMKELLAYADEECKDLWENLSLDYVNSRGHPLLRREVGRIHGVDPDNVLICAPQEGIMVGLRTLIKYCQNKYNEKKIHVVGTFPAYQSLLQHFVTLGCDVSHWHSKMTQTGWAFDLDELKKLIRDDTRILMINFPHNPTGYVPSPEQWSQIFQIARDHNLIVFSDELYKGSSHDGSTNTSAAAPYENAVALSGVSKVYGLPGIRMGWLCSQNKDLIDKAELLKDYTSFCPPAPSEVLALICLRNREKLIQRTMDIVKPNVDILDQFFKDHPGVFEWHKPKACTITMVKVKPEAMTTLGQKDTKGFCDVIRQEAGVMLAPSEIYDISGEYIRIGFGQKNLPKAVQALREYFANKGMK